ncbi:MAG: helix-turn-helix domain-containing protein [Halioglobus sp.]
MTKPSTKQPGEALGKKLLQSVKEMQAGQAARKTKVKPNEIAAARLNTGLTQAEFAKALQISARTLQEWEQGRRQPSGAAKALIQIASRHPDVITEEFELTK